MSAETYPFCCNKNCDNNLLSLAKRRLLSDLFFYFCRNYIVRCIFWIFKNRIMLLRTQKIILWNKKQTLYLCRTAMPVVTTTNVGEPKTACGVWQLCMIRSIIRLSQFSIRFASRKRMRIVLIFKKRRRYVWHGESKDYLIRSPMKMQSVLNKN